MAAWQRRLRRQMRDLLGLVHMPDAKCPLKIRSLWVRQTRFGSIEKLVFVAEPQVEVPCYLCLPTNGKPPYPMFICAQGHSTGMHVSIGVEADDETVPLAVKGDRDFAIGCMKRGIAALCIEQRAFGERREQHIGHEVGQRLTCFQASVNALLIGRTLIGERVYDVDRAIDVLMQHPRRKEFDMDRLGIMGNSGGGTLALFAAAMLPRLRYAISSCYFCTFRDSIAALHHCVCNYIPQVLRYAEMADIMGLFAPRPVVIVAGQTDAIFPLEATKRAFKHLRTIYVAAGAADKCKLVVGRGGHRFYAAPAWNAMLPMLR